MDKTRRLFLASIVVSSSLTLFTERLSAIITKSSYDTILGSWNNLNELSGVLTLGNSYLADFPMEANIKLLASKLLPAHKSDDQNIESGMKSIIEKHMSDCENLNMISVRGCLLSRTEARLYAYLTLHHFDGVNII